MLDNLSNPFLWVLFFAIALVLIRSRIRDSRQQRNIKIAVEKALEEDRKKRAENDNSEN